MVKFHVLRQVVKLSFPTFFFSLNPGSPKAMLKQDGGFEAGGLLLGARGGVFFIKSLFATFW